jgi:hypothetical protein
MSPIVQAILALLAQAPTAYAEIVALWNQIKAGVSAQTQAQVDALLQVLEPKTADDIAKLNADTAP